MEVPKVEDLQSAIARVRWAVLGTLVLCAVFSLLQTRESGALSSDLETSVTPVALVLAFVVMLTRQVAQRARAPRTRFQALLGTYLACGGLGLFGAALAWLGDDGSRGALFALGGAIFTIGTPTGPGIPRAS